MKGAKVLSAVLGTAVLIGTLASCGGGSEGWDVTVYYTPVEEFHGGDPVAVYGRPTMSTDTEEYLGTYPSDFVDAAKGEGTGRITSGQHAGKYLNWSWNIGYWLDTSTRDAGGDPLVPFETAAVDDVERGTPLELRACGVNTSGGPVRADACERLSSADWVVRDEFTPGLGGERRVDLYLGEQDSPDFTKSELWISWSGAEVVLGP